ncbi:MAG: hypothetical protein AB7E51_13025 [Pseudodesulfovibrio sp.]|uniref:hypothetical protein n=1 Tax=Pseudodesulfovibrio sp. TaxID=2035812 RepID=UPI003D0B22AF
MHIVLLTSEQANARERILITEGLLAHRELDLSFNRAESVMGKTVTEAAPDIHAALETCDYIFQFEDEHFFDEDIKAFIRERDLYRKLVYLDFKDSPQIEMDKLARSHRYFKRSWPREVPSNARFIRIGKHTVHPIAYGALKSYFNPGFRSGEFAFDISYMFPENVKGKRKAVRDIIADYDFGDLRVNMGVTTTDGGIGRRSITKAADDSPWAAYYRALNASKIVFTVLPNDWDGDSRTWEALAGQGMAFLDRPVLPFENRIEHLRHAYLFDAFSEQSVLEALAAAVDLLRNQEETRAAIAREGTLHAGRFHMGLNRVSSILSTLT